MQIGKGVGVGLRAAHYREFLQQRPPLDWLEVHTENYFQAGGWDRQVLFDLRRDYPVSLHGVGSGLGSAQGFSPEHWHAIETLVRELEPCLVSEHLCWGSVHDRNLNDLLPLPLSLAALDLFCERIDWVQERLKRPILIENVSTYLRYRVDAMSETEFLLALARRTGCQILLDVNNLYVNQCNHDESAIAAIHAIADAAPGVVGEIHLAGHLRADDVVIDNHGSTVADAVWDLYRLAIQRLGAVPTLIEWDTDIPTLPVLLGEADKARTIVLEASSGMSGTPVQQAARVIRTQVVNPGLHEVQAGPDDVGGIQLAFSDGLFAPDLPRLPFFAGSGETAMRRFARYRGNLVATWEKTMAAVFPVLEALVGEEFFAALARAYGHAYPSNSGDLNQFGNRFAQFLREFPHVAQYPYFPDVAALEWSLHRAYYAAEGTNGLDAAQLTAWSPEQLDATCFTLHPAASLLRSDFAVVQVWQAHQPGTDLEFPEQLNQSSHTLVYRPEWRPQVVALSPASYAALSGMVSGLTFGAALDAAFELDEAFDVAAHLQQCLGLLQMAHQD